MNKQTPAEIPVVEEKRDARPWLPEERQKFYECFAKHYKKFNIISEMIPTRSFTQVRQFFYRETKKIQGLLGESQNIINWDDKDHVICVFNSYSTLIKNGSDPAKVMKSKRYIERLKHKIEGINKRRQAQKERERQKLESARIENEKKAALKSTTVSLVSSPPDALGLSLGDQSFLPYQTFPELSKTMVIRLIPATDTIHAALRSCGYCPLLELTVLRSLKIQSIFNHLRSRWAKFCSGIRGVFRLFIASSSNLGVWVEKHASSAPKEPEIKESLVLPNSNSLLSSRMSDRSSSAFEKSYGNDVFMTMEQVFALSGTKEPLKLTYDFCVTAYSQRIHTYLLSTELPSQRPELYHFLVGATQSSVFAQSLLGDAPAMVEAFDVRKPKRSKAKEPTRRRSRKKQPDLPSNALPPSLPTLSNAPTLPSPSTESSLVTSFTDALPLISPKSVLPPPPDSFPLPSLELSLPLDASLAFSKPPAAKSSSSKRSKRDPDPISSGPSFSSSLNWTNPAGFIDPDRALNDPGFSLGSFSPFLGSSSKLGFDSTSRMGVLSPPPQFDSMLLREGEREDGNRASNLYNRMISAPTNSVGFGNLLSPNGMKTKEPIFEGNGEIFQKDNSLCFPCSFDTQV